MKQNKGHIVVVTYPLQGHAAPMVKLSQKIAEQGVKVTFVTTEFTSAGIAESMGDGERFRVVSVPDGLEAGDDRNDQRKVSEGVRRVMGGELEKLLLVKDNDDEKVSGVVVDVPLGWALDIPKKMGIKTAVYWGSTPGCLALGLKIPQLIEGNVIDNQGKQLKNEKIQLLPDFPAISPTEYPWYHPHNHDTQKAIFQSITTIVQTIATSDHYIITNWFPDLAPSASNLIPNLLPVGPLLSHGQSSGSFCPEDSSCLSWLDNQAPGSVTYVAFGSTTRFTQDQVAELARGLEIMDTPFLWVAWSGLTNGSFSLGSQDFMHGLGRRGKVVDWAPQEKVLNHPAIACFLTHCGWSSSMESLVSGVPFLCWPYFEDQLYTQTCVCEKWKVGLSLSPAQNGIISADEIKNKVHRLLSDHTIKQNALEFKNLALNSIGQNGSSTKNLQYLLQQIT
ncbi:PREDICTED: UDP-glycosyltransferase 83A1-like [Ipomoea nil]|uniref:UDP-glycosyltransferase 83A1-like n=1 Tax=Ipomoea nil TaxID=35883 RepID=UPI000901EA4A|nr:PREDICTED: UDP-glycosyltransferase 83A1-like [Ipomoea nil]